MQMTTAEQNKIYANTKTLLLRAAEILETRGWTQDSFAKDKDGVSVHELSKDAVCFCSLGALKVASEELNILDVVALSRSYARIALRETIGNPDVSIPVWNDQEGQTAATVIQTFRDAAESLKSIEEKGQ